MILPAYVIQEPCKFLEIMPKNITTELLKLCHMRHSSQSPKNQKADKVQVQEISIWNKDCTDCQNPDDVCYDLEESLSAFCLCPETSPETEIKDGGKN